MIDLATPYFMLFSINFSNLLIMSVPNEDYYRNASCALNLTSAFLLAVLA